jgi:TRAP-type C4-dicarboxylate transport system permease small subunit
MRLAQGVLKFLLRLEQAGTTLAFAVMVGVLAWDIAGRELFGGGKIWATPIAVYANVFMAFIGIGIASAHGTHLRPRFMDGLAPRSLAGAFDRFTDIGFALFAVGAGVLCWQVVQESIELQETDAVLQWQVWPFQMILVAAFALAATRHTLYALWPVLRPAAHGGENAPPTEEEIKAYAPPDAIEAPAQAAQETKGASR